MPASPLLYCTSNSLFQQFHCPGPANHQSFSYLVLNVHWCRANTYKVKMITQTDIKDNAFSTNNIWSGKRLNP